MVVWCQNFTAGEHLNAQFVQLKNKTLIFSITPANSQVLKVKLKFFSHVLLPV